MSAATAACARPKIKHTRKRTHGERPNADGHADADANADANAGTDADGHMET